MSDTNGTVGGGGPRLWGRRSFWIGGGILAGLAALAAVTPKAWAFRALAGHGFGGHPHRLGALMLHDPATAKQHVGTAVEWALRGVNASDDQKQQARRITDRLIDELAPLAETHREHHQALVAELQKPQIDREAIEKLRREELALADDASKKLLDGLTDLAAVLTPEQRTELVDLARRFHGEAPVH